MRFRVDVSTLDGKLCFEKDAAGDALDVAKGASDSLGVTITDTEDSKTYGVAEFEARFAKDEGRASPKLR